MKSFLVIADFEEEYHEELITKKLNSRIDLNSTD